MDVTIQRTDSDRSQNGGPRVSFNRDVHVKRIGPRPPLSDPIGSPATSSTASVFRRELPTDLTAEGIRKEAAKVLAQAGSVKCTAEGASNEIVGGRANVKSRGPIEKRRTFDYNSNKINFPKDQAAWLNPNRFNSLPTRKHKSKSGSKPVARSVSDASAKKSAAKRPSIFSIFSRKSDSNLHESSAQDGGPLHAKSASGPANQRKRVGRSKSDVGSQASSSQALRQQLRKRNNSENEEHLVASSAPKKNRAPLSPIIEQSQREDYFTADETIKAKLSVPPPVVPPKRRDKRNGNRSATASGSSVKRPEVEQQQEDHILEVLPSKPVAEAIKDTISTLKRSNSRVNQEMHSSQQPQVKPPLTKGVTVDGMVKRLSMERFSPPPHLSGPAFSYTRPKDQIIYAQVICDTDGKSKQTIHSSYENGTTGHETGDRRGPSPARNGVGSPSSHHLDAVDGHVKTTNTTSQHRHTQHFRHNSDEDEGLGLDIKARAVNDDFIPTHDRRYGTRDLRSTGSDDEFKSAVAEDLPITPKIRDVPPEKYVFHSEAAMRGRADGVEGHEFGDLSQRRAVLESRIQNRRFGSRDLLTEQKGDDEPLFKNPMHSRHHQQEYPTGEPVRMTKVSTTLTPTTNRDYLKRLSPPSRETDDHLHHHHQDAEHRERYQRSRSMDVTSASDRHNKNHREVPSDRYSPEQRSHLDMVSAGKYPPNGVTSKYEEESRYYHDGREGYKETIHRETNIGPDGKPRITESVSRERLDTPLSSRGRDDHYRDKYVKEATTASDTRRPNDTQHGAGEDDLIGGRRHYHHQQEWRSSSEPSRRHQKLQRSFDRGDSGIENDYRKDSFNDRDLRSKWKQRTYDDDRRACESFLRKERRHTVENHPVQWTRSYGYRERSIDDGSHFDPRLDRYSEDQGTLRRREKSAERHAAEKKKSGLEKVKQLLTGGSSKKNKTHDGTTSSSSLFTTGGGSSTLRSDKLTRERRHQSSSGLEDPPPPRSRFSESRTETSMFVEPQISDISTRRRLSTPKASPALPKRTSSQKSYKSSTSTSEQPQQPKLSWFKSLDRLSRKKDKSTLPPSSSRTSSAEEQRFNGHHSHTLKPTPSRSSSTHEQSSAAAGGKGNSSKTLRFFGDTDLESNGSYSKASWKNKTRQPLAAQKAFSKSAYDLDTINNGGRISSSRHKSTSLQHLDETDKANGRPANGRFNSKSRDLHDISESASDNELAASHHLQPPPHIKKTTHHSSSLLSDSSYNKSREQSPKPRSSLSSSRTASAVTAQVAKAATLNRNGKLSYDEDDARSSGRRSASVDARISTLSRHDYRKPPPAPQKPARTFEKRRSVSRGERDRVQDSSGTEGDSSQVSKGSVVFLHATTVGDIPQPQWLNSRSRAASRDSLSSKSTKNTNQPMTRTVSRSYSVLSPWTPRHLRDGYEINYSQQSNNNNNNNNHHSLKSNHAKASATTTQKQGSSGTTSTLPKLKTRSNTNTLTRYKKHNHNTSSSNLSKLRTDQPFDKNHSPSPPKSSNNRHHSGYRPPTTSAAAMDRPVERRIIQQQQRSSRNEEPDRYLMMNRRHRTLTPEPVSRYD